MGEKSAIEWTDSTWNVVTGCSKVSPGCAHCYAEALSLRYGWSKKPWTPEHAAENVILHPERLDLPLRWKKPRRIFVNSMSDLFHELVPDDFIDQVFAIMALTKQHTFQVLTKRPERMHAYMRNARSVPVWVAARERFLTPRDGGTYSWQGGPIDDKPWPLPNVWLGTSVENQHWADVRIPLLLDTPAAVRFLSCEPLLGPVDLSRYLRKTELCPWCEQPKDTWLCDAPGDEVLFGWPACNNPQCPAYKEQQASAKFRRNLHWVIVGGESGPHFRPFDPAWAAAIRDQCLATRTPFLFKQVGGRTPKAGGRLLDGVEWTEYPP